MSKRGIPTGKRYIYLRNNTYYARLSIPQDLREHFDNKGERWQSLKTSDLRVAELNAAQIINEWKLEFQRLKGDHSLIDKALAWKQIIETEREKEKGLIDKYALFEDGSLNIQKYNELGFGEKKLAYSMELEYLYDKKGLQAVQAVKNVVEGKALPTSAHIDDFMSTLKVIPRTLDQTSRRLKAFIERFPSLPIKKSDVAKWIHELEAQDKAVATIRGTIGSCRAYYEYLMRLEHIDPDAVNPFDKPTYTKRKKVSRKEQRQAWEVEDVVKLTKAAKAKRGDANLHDLILLGAFTGARLEEIVSLKVDDVRERDGIKYFAIDESKSAAGLRDLPVHQEILPLVDYLVANSKDGYLLPNEKINKKGERSPAIGKRFGRLKAKLGYDERYVFHSLRKTLSTQLERAGLHHNEAAELTGHEKVGETYGTYSAGLTIRDKAVLISKVSYKGLSTEPKMGKRK